MVDDHPVVRKGMRAILEEALPGAAATEAGSGGAALDLLAELKHRHPKLPVLIMSLHGEEQFAVRALKAGASGYLTKAAAPEELVAAVAKVARGGRYVSETLAERLAAGLGAADAAPHELLSDREFEVLRRIA